MTPEDAKQTTAQPAFRLRALSPAPLDSECVVPAGGLVIGRDSDQVDVVLSSSRVSRRHCRIDLSDGVCRIEDLDSTNGVFVNGRKIHATVDLKPGEVIGLGRADPPDFEFVCDVQAPRKVLLAPARSWRIGRALSADIPLPADPTVSEQHAEIRRDGDRVQVRDRGSLNGLRVRGRPLARNRWHELSDGDELELGNTRLGITPRADGGIEATVVGRNPGLTLAVERLTDERVGGEVMDLRLNPGTLVGITARHSEHAGALLELLAGRLSPTDGRVLHDRLPAGEGTGRHRIGYVETDHPLDGNLTTWQHLQYTARLRLPADMQPARREALLATTLAQLGLDNVRNVRLARLDAAHRRLVAIAAELVTRPALLCLASPFTELDDEQSEALLRRLKRLARTGTTVIVTGIGLAERDAFDTLIELDRHRRPTTTTRVIGTFWPAPAPPRVQGHVSLHRVWMLLSRQCRLRLLDPGTTTLYALLPILLTLAATALAGAHHPHSLVLMIVAMATALFTAAPEIGADRWRLRHEVHSGVLPGEDLVARMIFCWVIGTGQMLLAGSGMAWLTGMNLTDASALIGAMILVSFSATTLGLMIGTIDPTRARLVMPLAAAFVVLQWIVATGSAPEAQPANWLFGRIRDVLPAWWGTQLLDAFHAGFEQDARRAVRAGAFLTGQAITWMLIARSLLSRRIRQSLR